MCFKKLMGHIIFKDREFTIGESKQKIMLPIVLN